MTDWLILAVWLGVALLGMVGTSYLAHGAWWADDSAPIFLLLWFVWPILLPLAVVGYALERACTYAYEAGKRRRSGAPKEGEGNG